ncbi:hypothetical protein IJG79_00495 [Candidatus Saccharibacteria bacterium]|nr:hypothetical protein [Candidatus Saccharibacteria bacterium]
MSKEGKSTNTAIIVLLVILIVAVLGVGGYFIVKDITGNNSNNNGSSQTSSKQSADSGENDNGSSSNSDDGGSETTNNDIEAGITYAEVRGNDYFIELQTNGVVEGKCEISLVPTNGGQGHHDTTDLVAANKVSLCSEDFSLKGLNPGEHKITAVIRAKDGRTKTLEKIVKI